MEKESKLNIGIHRRIYNKNLKDLICAARLTAKQIKQQTNITEACLSQIINFHLCPNENQKIALAICLNVPIDDIFPPKYEELYEKINPLLREASIEVKMLQLDSPEVLALQSGDEDEVMKKAELKFMHDKLERIMQDLTPKQQKILKMRFGFDDGESKTLEEVGQYFNVSRERIRGIEEEALDIMRRNEKLLPLACV